MIIEDLNDQLNKGIDTYLNCTINLKDSIFGINSFENIFKLVFIDCIFIGEFIIENEISDEKFELRFKNCVFNDNVTISVISIKNLFIINSQKIKNINISGDFQRVRINGKDILLDGRITITNSNIFKELNLDNLSLIGGEIDISFLNKDKSFNYSEFNFSLKESTICRCSFFDSFFGCHVKTWRTEILYDLTFLNCIFNKSSFTVISTYKDVSFIGCIFLGITFFNESQVNTELNLKIKGCTFKDITLYDNYKVNKLEIFSTIFEKKVSFDNLIVKSFVLHQVQFLNSAYFDDLNINNNKVIENWDRKTLRAIKRELVNSHNQIDYLRFKAYELEAYNKENGKNWKDSFILKLNSCSSKNGLDWFRSVLFTIIISICFFYLYTVIEVYDLSRNPFEYSFISEERVKEYFFFLNPSDFDYHFNKLKNLKSNIGSTIIFLIAKVFITYGIYQTVQAFRKFGINGG